MNSQTLISRYSELVHPVEYAFIVLAMKKVTNTHGQKMAIVNAIVAKESMRARHLARVLMMYANVETYHDSKRFDKLYIKRVMQSA